MAQHDQVIDNGSGLTVRTDFNSAIAALFSNSSGPVEPSVTVAGQFWWDTANASNPILRQRNLANTGWMTVFQGGQASIDIAAGKRAGPPQDSFVWNDKLDLSGTDVMTLDDTGKLSILGDFLTAGKVTAGNGLTLTGGNVALGGGLIVDPAFAAAAALANKATLDLSALAAPRIIRVPNMDSVLGKWEPIADLVAAAVASIDVINLAPFRKLRITGALASTASTPMGYRTSANNGSSFSAGASDYVFQLVAGAGTSVIGSSGNATMMQISGGTTDANATCYFETIFEDFNKAASIGGLTKTKTKTASAIIGQLFFHADNLNVASNALRIVGGAGTISGTVSIEGWRG